MTTLTVYIGETVDTDDPIQLFRVDSLGVAEDVTTRTYVSQVREEPDSTDPLFAFTAAVIDGPTGVVGLTVDGSDTADLDVIDAVWSVTENGRTLFELPCAVRRPPTR